MSQKFSIVIPVYNEQKNIKILINEIIAIKNIQDYINEIIIVDDKSNDKSIDEINHLKKFNNKIKLLTHFKNLGQSHALLTAAKNSKSSILITIDADCQNNPVDIEKMIKIYISDDKIKLVAGIRRSRKDNLIKKISSKIANKIRKAILDDDCDDTGCSLKIFDKEIFLSLPFFNGIHRFLPALYKYKKSTNYYIDVDHRERINGLSKYGTFDRAFKGIFDLFYVRRIIKEMNRND